MDIATRGVTGNLTVKDIIQILDETGTPIKRFLHGQGIDDPVEMEFEGSVYAYVQDGLGSTIALISTADGSIAASYRYDAWGNVKYPEGKGVGIEIQHE